MKVDYEKYPMIPRGCLINQNSARNISYVFLQTRVKGKTSRTQVGKIDADGVFTFSHSYLKKMEIDKLQTQVRHLSAQRDANARRTKKADQKRAKSTFDVIAKAADEVQLDPRASNSSLCMNAVIFTALVAMLGTANDCEDICSFNLSRHEELTALLGEFAAPKTLSREAVRRILFIIDPQKVKDFVGRLVQPMLVAPAAGADDLRVIAADGQACRATGRRRSGRKTLSGTYYIMNLWDCENRLCIGQELIPKKRNEIKVLPEMLEGMDLKGAVLTADAMNTQRATAESICSMGADYCLAVKENQPSLYENLMYLFAAGADASHLRVWRDDITCAHGRIEQRITEVLPAKFLKRGLLAQWPGLASGCIVRTTTKVEVKTTAETSQEVRYFISSLPFVEGIEKKHARVVRSHWGVENRLHYMLDVLFNQDRMTASNANFIANSSAIRKLVLAILYREQRRLKQETGETVSIKTLRARANKIPYAVEMIRQALALSDVVSK